MSRATLNGIDANGQPVSNVGDPVAARDAVPKSWVRYDFGSFATGLPAAGELLMDMAVLVSFSLPVDLAGSIMASQVAANAQAVFSLKKNGTQIATITFAAGSKAGVFAASSVTNLVLGDELTLTAPASQDTTLAGLRWAFAGRR